MRQSLFLLGALGGWGLGRGSCQGGRAGRKKSNFSVGLEGSLPIQIANDFLYYQRFPQSRELDFTYNFMRYLQECAYNLLKKWTLFESSAVRLPDALIAFLRLHKSLLNLSYIASQQQQSYYFNLVLIARPQIAIEFFYLHYLMSLLYTYYALNILVELPGRPFVAVLGCLLRTAFFNLIYETSYSNYYLKALILLLAIFDNLFICGTLNIQAKNFQIIKSNFLGHLLFLLNLTILLLGDIQPSITPVFAYLSAVVQIFNQLLFSPYQSRALLISVISSQTVTLYVGAAQNFDFPSLLLVPFVIRITASFCNYVIAQKGEPKTLDQLLYTIKDTGLRNISEPKSNQDKIIYASLLASRNQTFKAMQLLQSLSKTTVIQQIKKDLLYAICLEKIDLFIHSKSGAQQGITEAVKQLMISEELNYQIYDDVKQVIQTKINLLLKMLNSKLTASAMEKYIRKSERLQRTIEDYYSQYPCDKSQKVLGFFYAEVANDIIAANNLFSILTISEEKRRSLQPKFSMFTEKLVYIISNYQEGLVIKRVSNNVHTLIDSNFLLNQKIDFLIPEGIRECHELLVKQFFATGHSKYMRNLAENFICIKDLIQTVEFAVDISLTQQLYFIAFMQPAIYQQMAMIIDPKQKIASCSENVQRLLKNQMIGLDVSEVIPAYLLLQQEYVDNFELSFQKHKYLVSFKVRHRYLEGGELLYTIVVFEYIKKVNKVFRQTSLQAKEVSQNSEEEPVAVTVTVGVQATQGTNLYDQINKTNNQQETLNINNATQEPTIMLMSPKSPKTKLLFRKNKKQQSYFVQQNAQEWEEIQKAYSSKSKEELHIKDRQMDGSSQLSSLIGIRNSVFFKKYELINRVNQIDQVSTPHKVLHALFVLSILLQLVISLIRINITNRNLQAFITDMDLIQIQGLVLAPIETFLLTRWTLFNYKNLRTANVITEAEYVDLVQFPNLHLSSGYNDLANNLKKLIGRKSFQNLIKESYLEIRQYAGTNQFDTYNLSCSDAIKVLLNFQFELKQIYDSGKSPDLDSAPIYYQYINRKTLKDIIRQIYYQSQLSSIQKETYLRELFFSIFMICLLIGLLFTLLQAYYVFKISKHYQSFIGLYNKCRTEYCEDDLFRYSYLLDRLNKNQSHLFQYTFNLEQKEIFLQRTQLISHTPPKFIEVDFKPSLTKWYLLLLAILLFIVGIALLIFIEIDQYFALYPQTLRFYKQIAELNVDIPTLYAQREVIYNRKLFLFIDQQYVDYLLEEIRISLKNVKQMTQLSISDALYSENIQSQINNLKVSSLCDHSLYEARNQVFFQACERAFNGNLLRGLEPLLVYVATSIETEIDVNGFSHRSQTPLYELEGAYIISQMIFSINNRLNEDLNEQTLRLQFMNSAYNYGVICFQIMFAFVGLIALRKHQQREVSRNLRAIHVIPFKTILFEESFIRYLRGMLSAYQ